MYSIYPLHKLILRRTFVVTVGIIGFPVVLLLGMRSKFYSFLHKMWHKTSTKPVWLKQSEKAKSDFY
uniref:DUF2517 family protein n=1 Tax=Thaumasiovibrio occultus TaxID=1891184 RepID=UPI000B34D5CE|nr:DUF2517 family protein [Thaumasiovibrio occultus]